MVIVDIVWHHGLLGGDLVHVRYDLCQVAHTSWGTVTLLLDVVRHDAIVFVDYVTL